MSFEERDTDLVENFSSLGLKSTVLSPMRRWPWITSISKEAKYWKQESSTWKVFSCGSVLQSIPSVPSESSSTQSKPSSRVSPMRLFSGRKSEDFSDGLKDRGVTAVITCEQGKGTLTRHGLEEYVSDCVIFLDHRMIEQVRHAGCALSNIAAQVTAPTNSPSDRRRRPLCSAYHLYGSHS